MKKQLALFDFDGTITRKDTLFEVIRYIRGTPRLYSGMVALSPILLQYKCGLLPNWKAKEKVLSYYLGDMDYNDFQQRCDQFSQKVIPSLVRPDALVCLKQYHEAGMRIVVVSASAENWLSAWCKTISAELIATRLEIKAGKITGHLSGKNCHGEEKVHRIRQEITLSDYDEIHAFGDSRGDLPMLSLATHPHYCAFTG